MYVYVIFKRFLMIFSKLAKDDGFMDMSIHSFIIAKTKFCKAHVHVISVE